jgi:RHS repeat-associated protein
MLKRVKRPDGKVVSFEYDALGRRTAKLFEGQITRFVWDGNTPLHEWKYTIEDRPKTVVDELGLLSKDKEEPLDHLTTWVFDEGSFRPAAKIIDEERYSIINDHLGTPKEAYNSEGKKVWECELTAYGKVKKCTANSFVPFRFQGQYHDEETGLYYNRFRYYSPEEAMYVTAQDPIGLRGGDSLCRYVRDPNAWVDVLGLYPTLSAIQDKINSILLEHLPAIQEIDPNAQVGYRGSAASGISKAHDPKISKPFNPGNFDVDAFIQSDYLANDPVFTNRRREASEIIGMGEIEESIDKKLREAFPGLKEEPFGFRIFQTHELDDMVRKGDVQVRLNFH